MARRRRVVALVADDIVGDRAVIYAAEERHVCDDQKNLRACDNVGGKKDRIIGGEVMKKG
jgi:hypothetical protein